jgi:hypothetical protein
MNASLIQLSGFKETAFQAVSAAGAHSFIGNRQVTAPNFCGIIPFFLQSQQRPAAAGAAAA